jgi:hypothetical protein
MQILPLVYIEPFLIVFVCQRIFFMHSDHHLITRHVIHHHIFQSGHESLRVDEVKVNQFVVNDLNADVAFDEVDEATDFDLVVDYPFSYFVVVVPHLAEEKDLGGGPNADGIVKEELHLAELKVVDVFKSIFL